MNQSEEKRFRILVFTPALNPLLANSMIRKRARYLTGRVSILLLKSSVKTPKIGSDLFSRSRFLELKGMVYQLGEIASRKTG